MKVFQTVGNLIALRISDPWDFGTQCGVGPFFGSAIDEDNNRLLLLFTKPITYLDLTYQSALCSLRHKGSSIRDLICGGAIAVNVVLLTDQPARLNDVRECEFKKGFAAIGSLEISKKGVKS